MLCPLLYFETCYVVHYLYSYNITNLMAHNTSCRHRTLIGFFFKLYFETVLNTLPTRAKDQGEIKMGCTGIMSKSIIGRPHFIS